MNATLFRRRAGGRLAPFLCKVHNFHPFFLKCLCKLTKRNFLKPLDISHPLWYNINVVKGRGKPKLQQGREQKSKKFFKNF